jgi:hypothetical protein
MRNGSHIRFCYRFLIPFGLIIYGSIHISVIPKGSLSAFGNGFAPVKLINAIPLPPFSAVLNSAPKHPSLLLYLLFPCLSTTRILWQSRAQYSSTDNMGTSPIVPLEERAQWLNLQWSLQPSPKTQFITAIRMDTSL